eukprot:SAG11_NODE_5758_length_1469_cov_1.461314_1_plen_141_part_00
MPQLNDIEPWAYLPVDACHKARCVRIWDNGLDVRPELRQVRAEIGELRQPSKLRVALARDVERAVPVVGRHPCERGEVSRGINCGDNRPKEGRVRIVGDAPLLEVGDALLGPVQVSSASDHIRRVEQNLVARRGGGGHRM